MGETNATPVPANPAERDRLLEENRRLAQRYLELEETTRKQLEKLRTANDVLGRGESHMRILLENAAVGFALIDRNMRVVSANQTLCETLGYSRGEFPGENFANFVYVAKLPVFNQLVGDTPSRTQVNETVELVARNGALVPCRMAVSDWLDDDGAAHGTFILVFDIGEEKRATERLHELEEKVVELSKSRKFFLDAVSRELRSPAIGITGMIRMLMDADLTERQSELASVIESSSLSLVRLVDDLVDISRLDSDDAKVSPKPMCPADVIRSAADMYRVRAGEKGIDLATSVAPGVPDCIVADADRIRRVLAHLLDNAVKFTSQGRVTVSLDCVNDAVRFMVSDTGGGIHVEPGQDIFGFGGATQAIAVPPRRHGGIGMGLLIARRLVTLMGGKIGYETEEGRGSEFHFTLPIVVPREDEAMTPPEVQPEPARLPPLGILLADGNAMSRRIASAFLQYDGHRLVQVDNGMEAVSKCRAAVFDLIILDLHLPRLDGLQALRLIREDEKASGRARTPILLAGAQGQLREKGYYNRAGADGVLKKPFQPVELMAALGAATGVKPVSDTRIRQKQAGDRGPGSISSAGTARRLDQTQFSRLRQTMPDDQFQGFLRHFVEDGAPAIHRLQDMSALANPDREAIADGCVKAKGLAGYIGFAALAEALSRLEGAARRRMGPGIMRSLGDELATALAAALAELRLAEPGIFTKAEGPDPVLEPVPSSEPEEETPPPEPGGGSEPAEPQPPETPERREMADDAPPPDRGRGRSQLIIRRKE